MAIGWNESGKAGHPDSLNGLSGISVISVLEID
jgi:hypothetical protein